MRVSSLMQTGKVATPDCLRTLGLLGAESSATTAHLGSPLPVLVAVQPGGGAPVLRLSKLTVSADALPVMTPIINPRAWIVFITALAPVLGLLWLTLTRDSVAYNVL